MAKNTVIISVLADTKQFAAGFKDSESVVGKIGKIAGAAAVAVGALSVAVGAKAVASASALEQALGGLDAVFKGASGQMRQFATDAAQSVGLAQSDYAQLATVLGSQLKNMGVASDEVAGKTNELVGLGADLAAQFGGSTSDAVSALSSLLRGERDPIERYGVSINEARLQAKLAEMGLAGLTGEALTQAKTQATLALLYEQTADAQGAFARESSTLAGQQERLRAGTENLYSVLGTALLPAATAVVGVLGQLVDVISKSDAFASFTAGLAGASTAVAGFLSNLISGNGVDLSSMFSGLLDSAIAGVTKAASWLAAGGAQQFFDGLIRAREAILNGAMQAFPAILDGLVQVIPQIVAGLSTLIQQLVAFIASSVPVLLAGAVTLFTSLIDAVLEILPLLLTTILDLLPQLVASILSMLPGILDAAVKLFTALIESLPIILPKLIATIVGLLPTLVMTILTLIPNILAAAVKLFTSLVTSIPLILPNLLNEILRMLPQIVRSVISMLPALLDAGINLFTALVTAIPNIVTKLVPALLALGPTLVQTIISMAPQLMSAGGDLIQGLVNGLVRSGARVGTTLLNIAKNAVGSFLSFFGIRSPSRLFDGFGVYIDQGLARGLERGTRHVARAMDTVNASVVDSFDAELTPDGMRLSVTGGAGASTVGNTYNLTVQAVAPGAEVGRAVVDAIDAYERLRSTQPLGALG